jgi:MFS family permease
VDLGLWGQQDPPIVPSAARLAIRRASMHDVGKRRPRLLASVRWRAMPDVPAVALGAAELPLARNRNFRLLTASQAISAVGDMVSITALPLLVLGLTGSGVAMGTVFAIGAVADFAVALYAGALADRIDRKRMMVVADVGRAVLTALIPLSIVLGGPTMAVVLLVAAPMALLRSFFRAGYIASVPAIAGRQHLARANGILETVSSTSSVLGPLVAGFLIAAIGAGLTLAVDALSFAISAVGLFLMSSTIRAPSTGAPTRIVDDIREGVSFVAHDRVLRVLIAYFALFSMLVGPVVVALAVRLTRDLGEGPGAYGAVIAAFGVGTIGGGLLAARLGRRMNVPLVFFAGVAAEGLASIGIALSDSLLLILVLAAITGVGESVVTIVYITARAARAPDALLGRVGSTARMVSLGLAPIGFVVAGLLIDSVGGTATIAILGVAMCVLAVAFTPVRGLRAASVLPAASA